jgi:predicted aspartyl protease
LPRVAPFGADILVTDIFALPVRSRKYRTLVCALLLVTGCNSSAATRTQAPADSATGEVEFALLGPNEAALVVPVSINGRAPVNFILDTGATLTCIDVSLARVLELPDGNSTSGVAIGAMSAGRVETVMIDTLRIGNAAAYDLLACQLDLAALREALGVQGLIGLNFLKSFDVALDFEHRVLRLTTRAD